MYFLFRPFTQTKKQIALNLILAPIISLPLIFLSFICLSISLDAVADPVLDNPYFILFMIFTLVSAVFFVVICLHLFPYFLILRRHSQFHVINILSASLFITFIFAFISDSQNLLKSFIMLSIFSMPITIVFIFLTIRNHKV